jgi:peptidoglycan/LPS O-acetylase OafA/YrhL
MTLKDYPALHLYSLCCFVLFSLFFFVFLFVVLFLFFILFILFLLLSLLLFVSFLYHMHYAFQETNLYFMEISSYNLVS